MKNMTFILAILFFITGCSEEETKQQENSIYGTWQLVEQYVVSGVNGNWTEIHNGYQFAVELDNSFSSSQFTECGEGIVDFNDVQITFEYNCDGFSTGIESPPGLFSYSYIFVDNKLSLSPNFLNCDEGCGFRFKKIAEPQVEE